MGLGERMMFLDRGTASMWGRPTFCGIGLGRAVLAASASAQEMPIVPQTLTTTTVQNHALHSFKCHLGGIPSLEETCHKVTFYFENSCVLGKEKKELYAYQKRIYGELGRNFVSQL